jgi:hypothetical protein
MLLCEDDEIAAHRSQPRDMTQLGDRQEEPGNRTFVANTTQMYRLRNENVGNIT